MMALRRHDGKKTYVMYRQLGIFASWPECHRQVDGFPVCLYRAYSTREEAESEWLRYWEMVPVGVVPPVENNVVANLDVGNQPPIGIVRVEGDNAQRNDDVDSPSTSTMAIVTTHVDRTGMVSSLLSIVLLILGLLTVAMIIVVSIWLL
ncbi:Ribosomal protein L9/RNase H1, N-terminal [Sesbania bispinosa]|nr:Ribosomal protein L9/RNase H1, N-terminal [Sesbania bispinosa]